jgi:hypothetical protein
MLMRLPSARRGACAPTGATTLKLTPMGSYRSAVRLFLMLNHMPDRGTMTREAILSFDKILLCNLDS